MRAANDFEQWKVFSPSPFSFSPFPASISHALLAIHLKPVKVSYDAEEEQQKRLSPFQEWVKHLQKRR